MNPQFEDEDAVKPFDLWAGANFKLKIRNVEGYRNYDKSEFDKVKPLLDNDDSLEQIWKSEHSLQSFLEPSNFKSYDELKAKLNKALAETDSPKDKIRAEEANIPWGNDEDEAPKFKSKPASKPAIQEDEDDDEMEFFKKLAQ